MTTPEDEFKFAQVYMSVEALESIDKVYAAEGVNSLMDRGIALSMIVVLGVATYEALPESEQKLRSVSSSEEGK